MEKKKLRGRRQRRQKSNWRAGPFKTEQKKRPVWPDVTELDNETLARESTSMPLIAIGYPPNSPRTSRRPRANPGTWPVKYTSLEDVVVGCVWRGRITHRWVCRSSTRMDQRVDAARTADDDFKIARVRSSFALKVECRTTPPVRWNSIASPGLSGLNQSVHSLDLPMTQNPASSDPISTPRPMHTRRPSW